MRKLLILLFLLVTVIAEGRKIPESEASAIASKFLNSVTVHPTSAKVGVRRAKASNATDAEGAPFYIFNADDNKGFVIVSGDNRARKILGWSHSGNINIENLPPQLSEILMNYHMSISALGDATLVHPTWDADSALQMEDKAILNTAKWNQFYPYNLQLPNGEGDVNYPAGCVPIATAIVMKYHSWPSKGNGLISYEYNGQSFQTDLNQSEYHWELMFDDYEGRSLTLEEEDAISSLVKDVGYAMHTSYEMSGSGAGVEQCCLSLFRNFGYHNTISTISISQTSANQFFNILKNEIDNCRPTMFVSGYTPAGIGGHQYVGDGYACDSYVHFNFGWSGNSNGFYTIDPVNSFAGFDMTCIYGIEPMSKPQPEVQEHPFVTTSGDFYYSRNNTVQCEFSIPGRLLFEPTILAFGFAISNDDSHEKQYVEYDSKLLWEPDDCVFAAGNTSCTMTVPDDLPDGQYTLTPAFRLNQNSWHECEVSVYNQASVKLKVENGIYTYVDTDPILVVEDEGHILIDGIYYILDDDSQEATVTSRNYKGRTYRGDISIPEYIVYNDRKYTVTVIGENAFANCLNLGDVILPMTIKEIRPGAFSLVAFNSINLGDLINLKKLDGWAFTIVNANVVPSLPPNLEYIGILAIQQGGFFDWPIIEIPASVKTIPFQAFNINLDAIIFHAENLSDVSVSNSAFLLGHDWVTVFVPKGMKDKYQLFKGMASYANQQFVCDFVEYDQEFIPISRIDAYIKGHLPLSIPNYPKNYYRLSRNHKLEIELEISPENATKKDLYWEVDDFLTKSHDGYFYLADDKPLCTTSIRLHSRDGSRIVDELYIEFMPGVEEVILEPAEINLSLGESAQILATVLPAHAYEKTLVWSSSNESVAVVDQTGFVTALSEGKCIVTAKATDGSEFSATCEIKVKKPVTPISSIILTPDSATGMEGEQIQISATVLPEDATDKTISWSSSDDSIATVSDFGLVSLIRKGTAVITASATGESGVSVECPIIVTEYSGIEDALSDKSAFVRIYNMQGMQIYEGLYSEAKFPPDYYIVVCRGKSIKMMAR